MKDVLERGIRGEWLVQKEREIGNVEEKWLACKEAVIKCAGDACGMRKLRKRGIRKGNEWWNEDIESSEDVEEHVWNVVA